METPSTTHRTKASADVHAPTGRRCYRGVRVHEKTEGSYPNRTDFYPSRKCLNKADISGLNCLYYISSVRYPYSRLALCGILCSIILFKIKFNIIKESLDLQLNEKLWKVSKLKKSPITHLNVSVWEYFSPTQGSKLVSHIQEDVPGTASAHLCFMFYSPISWILPIYHTHTNTHIHCQPSDTSYFPDGCEVGTLLSQHR